MLNSKAFCFLSAVYTKKEQRNKTGSLVDYVNSRENTIKNGDGTVGITKPLPGAMRARQYIEIFIN